MGERDADKGCLSFPAPPSYTETADASNGVVAAASLGGFLGHSRLAVSLICIIHAVCIAVKV